MKKILHIAEPFATGVLQFLVSLTKFQIEEFEVTILWGERPLTPPDVEDLFDPRVKLIKSRYFGGAFQSLINPRTYAEVRAICKQEHPDIVHLHSSAAGFIGRWALPVHRIPTFYTPHGFPFLTLKDSLFTIPLYWAIEFLTAFRTSKTIACSKSEQHSARYFPRTVECINNGIDHTLLHTITKPATRPLRICTSGRITSSKAPELFNAIALALPELSFLWIGDGEARSALTAPNITITGWLSKEEAAYRVAQSHCFLFPSLREGLSLALLEAMYLETICVVSNIPGNHNAITHGESGFICKTLQEYVVVLRTLQQDQELRNKIASTAKKQVEQHFTAQKMATSYSEIYNSKFR